ncbi:MAG: sulfur carrier protein ThiS [Alphaproteobacteria bacterium]
MEITLNGKTRQLDNSSPGIPVLLEQEGFANKKIAIAINGKFVPRSAYDTHIINNNDNIEIVAPMQGG